MDKVTAIVLAAGRGSRMKSDIQKQFMLLGDYPVVYYSLRTFDESDVDDIILVTGEQDIEYCKQEIVGKYKLSKVSKVIAGGKERYDSVRCALLAAKDSKYVIIHDGARPFVTKEMIENSIANVKKYGACTIAVPVKDTIKIVDGDNFGIDTPDRKYVYQIQTPQSFDKELLLGCYKKLNELSETNITDDTMLVEMLSGTKTKILEGAYTNIKITTPEDIKIAKIFLKNVLT